MLTDRSFSGCDISNYLADLRFPALVVLVEPNGADEGRIFPPPAVLEQTVVSSGRLDSAFAQTILGLYEARFVQRRKRMRSPEEPKMALGQSDPWRNKWHLQQAWRNIPSADSEVRTGVSRTGEAEGHQI